MMATDRRVWAPGWRANHGRQLSGAARSAEAQARIDEPAPG